jgi:hypothetical protein
MDEQYNNIITTNIFYQNKYLVIYKIKDIRFETRMFISSIIDDNLEMIIKNIFSEYVFGSEIIEIKQQ